MSIGDCERPEQASGNSVCQFTGAEIDYVIIMNKNTELFLTLSQNSF